MLTLQRRFIAVADDDVTPSGKRRLGGVATLLPELVLRCCHIDALPQTNDWVVLGRMRSPTARKVVTHGTWRATAPAFRSRKVQI